MENGDLLQKIFEEITVVKTEIKSFSKIYADHEKRIRFLEKGFYIALGVLALVSILLKYLD